MLEDIIGTLPPAYIYIYIIYIEIHICICCLHTSQSEMGREFGEMVEILGTVCSPPPTPSSVHQSSRFLPPVLFVSVSEMRFLEEKPEDISTSDVFSFYPKIKTPTSSENQFLQKQRITNDEKINVVNMKNHHIYLFVSLY